MLVESAIFQWEDGTRRLRAAEPHLEPVLERVVGVLVDDLRRRLGGPFLTAELAALYSEGTDWALDLAMATAPTEPAAWDSAVVVDAAFARYSREASDFGGGRRWRRARG